MMEVTLRGEKEGRRFKSDSALRSKVGGNDDEDYIGEEDGMNECNTRRK